VPSEPDGDGHGSSGVVIFAGAAFHLVGNGDRKRKTPAAVSCVDMAETDLGGDCSVAGVGIDGATPGGVVLILDDDPHAPLPVDRKRFRDAESGDDGVRSAVSLFILVDGKSAGGEECKGRLHTDRAGVEELEKRVEAAAAELDVLVFQA